MLDALEPDKSVVVEACAGSGKTWLLVSRIIRLLLAGVAPGEILAITFTRKGSREMQERLREWLEDLVTKPDAWVEKFLLERGIATHELPSQVAAARGLLERVLTAQPGIKINTFHGWFADLVQRAPLQAGVAKGYALTEAVHPLEQEAWQRFGAALTAPAAAAQQAALDELFREIGLHSTRRLLSRFLNKRPEWWSYVAGQSDPTGFAAEQLARQTGVDPQRDYVGILLQDNKFVEDLKCVQQSLNRAGASQTKIVASIDLALAQNNGARQFAGLIAAFHTKSGTVLKALESHFEKYDESVSHAAGRVIAQLQTTQNLIAEQRVLRLNRAAFIAGQCLLEQYQQLKSERNVMDFTDVEYAAYTLLHHSDFAEYMQYKLDSRYRHILLDEFQDTNPLQWMTLQAWLQASSDADLRPTVFLVGDPKQSIFHFRRADARLFAHATAFLQRDYQAAVLQRNMSRRSGVDVLDAVNSVFTTTKHLSGFVSHLAADKNLPGAIVLLPLPPEVSKHDPPTEQMSGLRNLLTMPQINSDDRRRALEATALARGIRKIVSSWQVQDAGVSRRASYRDILILTRGRTQLHRYEAALRAAGIPFHSARHGGLLDSLEAQDLTALLNFLLRPTDNLSLVHALRAPLFGCADEDLIDLAQAGDGDWWNRLSVGMTQFSIALQRAYKFLARWLSLAANLPVHDLLDRIYFESDLEQRYRAAVPDSMQRSVQSNLTAFMALSLSIDSGRYPSLGRFLGDLKALGQAPDNEAPDEGSVGAIGNVVRIMTVHGAKGLESPIVWMIDATFTPKAPDAYDVLVTWPTASERPNHFSFLTTKSERGVARDAFIAEEAAITEQEDANLLYVAMTRAKQYLIASGNRVGTGKGSWYEALQSVITPSELLDASLPHTETPKTQRELSAVRRTDPPRQHGEAIPHGTRKQFVADKNRDYGIKLHALLEIARDGEVTDAMAAAILQDIEIETRSSLLKQARAILRAPHLKQFFDPRRYLAARNEVNLIDGAGELLRLDRVVEFDESVWVLDYKSEGSVAGSASKFILEYRNQLLNYRRVLLQIYPGKSIRAALIFGDGRVEEVA